MKENASFAVCVYAKGSEKSICQENNDLINNVSVDLSETSFMPKLQKIVQIHLKSIHKLIKNNAIQLPALLEEHLNRYTCVVLYNFAKMNNNFVDEDIEDQNYEDQ
uniref:Uncharacterized protein n=1 Tax=Romanomermis culicivorax TaxID=13658 RepID=A0A915IHT6_ROMCU